MGYEKGDIVVITALTMKRNPSAGWLLVKITRLKDGLYFRPFLLKHVKPIPIFCH
jgi:hypothetical protein